MSTVFMWILCLALPVLMIVAILKTAYDLVVPPADSNEEQELFDK